MLASGVIKTVQNERASPIVLVPKKDGTFHFCVEYPKLKAMKIGKLYAIPHIDKLIALMGKDTVPLMLDTTIGYWQVITAEEGCGKTVLTPQHGSLHFTRMSFGLKKAPGTFQQVIDVLCTKEKRLLALVY